MGLSGHWMRKCGTGGRLLVAALSLLFVVGCLPRSGGDDDGDNGNGDGNGTLTGGTASGADASADSFSDGGGGGGVDGGTDTPKRAYRTAVHLLVEAYCKSGYRCPQKLDESQHANLSRYGDSSSCVQKISSLTLDRGRTFSRIKEDLEQGLTMYNRGAAEKCISKLRAAVQGDSCQGLRAYDSSPVACRRMFTGTHAQGDPCYAARHCKTNRCDYQAMSDKCYGVCAPSATFVDRGDTCDYSAKLCNPSDDLLCVYDSSSSESVCRRIGSKSKGDSCSRTAVCGSGLNCLEGNCQRLSIKSKGGSCGDTGARCEVGLVCVKSVSGSGANETVSGTCKNARSVGDDCYENATCKPGLYCKGGEFVPSAMENSKVGTCEKKRANGQSCSSDSACQSQNCVSETCREVTSSDSCEVPTGG